MYYKLTDQQEKTWGHDGELLSSNRINTVAPFAFFTASNHETDFYALADIANANRMKLNIDTDGEGWACKDHEDERQDNAAFTRKEAKDAGKHYKDYWPQDLADYDYQHGTLECKGGTIRILLSEVGRLWNKPVCLPKYMTDTGTNHWKNGEKEVLTHQDTDMRAICIGHSNAYKRIKAECNSEVTCQARPLSSDKEQGLKSSGFKITRRFNR